jgi:cinnamoyl-CoA reductase
MGVWDSFEGERGVQEVAQTGKRKYVCVTGNWSLLGSWLVRTLLERGYNVRSTIRTTVGNHLHPMWPILQG